MMSRSPPASGTVSARTCARAKSRTSTHCALFDPYEPKPAGDIQPRDPNTHPYLVKKSPCAVPFTTLSYHIFGVPPNPSNVGASYTTGPNTNGASRETKSHPRAPSAESFALSASYNSQAARSASDTYPAPAHHGPSRARAQASARSMTSRPGRA